MLSKYYISKYFQKSKNFLLPLVTKEIYKTEVNSYLFCNKIEESIEDYNLIINFLDTEPKDTELLKNTLSVYDSIYIIDISEWKYEVDLFMEGKYSKLSNEAKKRILKYWGALAPNNQFYNKGEWDGNYCFYSFLFPQNYKKEVAKELCGIHNLFNSEVDALETLNSMKEICPIYNKEKETLIL